MPATEQTWYSQKLLNKVFAVSGVVLLVATIWMFAKDNDREWKRYQEKFRDIEVTSARWQEIRAEAERNKEAGDRFKQELLVAQSSVPPEQLVNAFLAELEAGEGDASSAAASIRTAYDKIPAPPEAGFPDAEAEEKWRAEATRKRDELIAAMAAPIARARFVEESVLDQRKMQAANYDAAKSVLDLAVRDGADTTEPRRKATQVEEELNDLTLRYQKAAAHRKALQSILDQITQPVRDLQKSISENTAELHQIAKGLEDREAQWFEGWWLGKKFLEQPILDAFNSPLKIENSWTDGLTHEMYNFKAVLRYDRCTTCHQAIDKTAKGSATEPLFQPEHELVVSLATPSREELDALKPEDRRLLDVVYGFQLANQGMLDRDDVTVNFVRSDSRAAKAPLVPDEQSVDYLAREIVESSVDAVFNDRVGAPVYGLQVADVILRVNDDFVDSQDDVRRMLLETVKWGEPVQLTVRRGYPHPFQTHPRLDLYVGSTSPHPKQALGCTVCHDGQGSATAFNWASHYPNSLKQREEWRLEHGWFDNHHWIYPMMPERFVESSCLKCHHDVSELEPSEKFPEPPAPSLMAGYNDVRRYGCFGCHEVVGYDGPDKRIGPDLRLEPNYFAAGLQLAYLATQRERVLTRAEAEEEAASTVAGGDAEALTAESEQTGERLATLGEVRELGRQLGARTYDNAVRHRLKEIVDQDKKLWTEFERAVAAGEEVESEYVPLFTSEAYDVADVLKDDETPGSFRKVGPSLRYVDAKLGAVFLDDWIREPNHFRPSTRMPQFFQLHNHLPADELAHTQHLESAEIKGIRTYLMKYSQPFTPVVGGEAALQAAITPGDAARGKVQFEIGGCLACHSNQDFPGQGNQGPDLSGLGSKFGKLDGDKGRPWLYGWIQDPKRYHARTKMPVVPLKPLPGAEETDPIADIVEYLLSDVGAWTPVAGAGEPVDANALNEITLMHLEKAFYAADAEQYLKNGIPESRRSTLKGAEVELLMADELVVAGSELSQEKKLLYLGRKTIAKYGCYACHDIPGFEGAKPIGTALSDWGRKEPAKLAFEHITHYVGGHGHSGPEEAAHGDGSSHESEHATHGAAPHSMADPTADVGEEEYFVHELNHHSRMGFLYQKLKEPRSYDFEKTENKPYNDRLRMPQFPLNFDERQDVMTFVLGLVADPPPQQFVYDPSPRQHAINQGRKVLDKFNCGGCHELEREQWTISMPANWSQLRDPEPPSTFPFLIPHVTPEELEASKKVTPGGRQIGTLAGRVKLTPRGGVDVWVFDEEEEDYLTPAELEAEEFRLSSLAYRFELYEPSLLAGKLFMPKAALPVVPLEMVSQRHRSRGGNLASYLVPRVIAITAQDKGEEAWGWVPPSLVGEGEKVQPDWLHSFLLDPHPIRPAVVLNMPKFNMSPDDATKLVNYFSATDNVEYPYQYNERTRTGHLQAAQARYESNVAQLPPDRKALFSGSRFDDAMAIVVSQAGCVKCHSVDDYVSQGDPRAKGPNLQLVHQRLQPDYVRRWVAKPSFILPYTAMPELFKYSPQSPEQDGFYDAKPDGKLAPLVHGVSTEQLDAVVDLLMNFDKYAEAKTSIAEIVPQPPEAAPAEGAAPAAEPPAEGTAAPAE